MPAKLTTTVSKIALVPNQTNLAIIEEFRAYMKARGSSEQHQNNNLKVAIAYANFLGPNRTFFDVQQKKPDYCISGHKSKAPRAGPGKEVDNHLQPLPAAHQAVLQVAVQPERKRRHR
jgi:hypothetical protein